MDNEKVFQAVRCNAYEAINNQDKHGNTPLWFAVFNARENHSIVALMMKASGDPYLINNY